MSVIEVGDTTFSTHVLEAEGPVLVDFWAPWSGPSVGMGRVLDDLAREMSGRLSVARVNTDESPDTPRLWGVRGVPTLMVFDGGLLVASKVGSLSVDDLYRWIDLTLANRERKAS